LHNLLFRIDSRCLHGQVIAGWGVQEQIKRFLLANNEVAADAWERNQYLAAPGSEFETYVTSIQEAIRLLKEWTDDKKTMLVLRSPHDALRILDGGIIPERIAVGNLDPGAGKKELSPSVFATGHEQRDLLELLRRGVQVFLQPLPSSKPVPLAPENLAIDERRTTDDD
jgi:mannose/fructose/N-acetylgalactosamine-specific phosphotransferase system component IIB